MKMLRTNLCAGAAVVVFSGVASANITFSQSQAFGGDLSPFSTALVFEQINEVNAGQPFPDFLVLLSVGMSIEATISVSAAVENESAQPSDGVSLTMAGFLTASGQSLSVGSAFFLIADSGPLAPSDGVPGSGPDFHDFGTLGTSGSDNDLIFNGFAPFIGYGTFVVDVLASGGVNFLNSGGTSTSLSDFSIEGVVTVEINYLYIPAPSTLGVMAGGLLLVRRRR